jgi:hypothetical protein
VPAATLEVQLMFTPKTTQLGDPVEKLDLVIDSNIPGHLRVSETPLARSGIRIAAGSV